MTGGEIIAETIKSVLGLCAAAALGWVLAMWKKPSRAEFSTLTTRVEANERELHAQSTMMVELRMSINGLAESFKDGVAQLRRDIRELRGEHRRDTDP